MKNNNHPVGTIVVVWVGRKRQRRIKVLPTGKGQPKRSYYETWKSYAVHLWEQHHGPIPQGKKLYHINGNRLDDRIENLAVGSSSDCVRNWIKNNPDKKAAQYASVGRWLRNRNKSKAISRRVLGLLPNHYYPVDRENRVILNTPFRSRTHLYASVGIDAETIRTCIRANIQGLMGAVLGWPGLGNLKACALAVMLGRDWTAWRDVWPEVERFCKDRVDELPKSWRGKYRIFAALAHRGLLERRITGKVAEWRPTPQATLTRGVWTNYVALPGKEAARLGYRRIDPKFGDVTVPNETVMLRVIRTVKAEARANKATP